MYGSDRLRDIHALEYYLYGGVSREEFEREGAARPRHVSNTDVGTITGYVEMDLNTGEITCHAKQRKKTSTIKPHTLETV